MFDSLSLESVHYFLSLVIFGTIPSLIWLFYYLRKDSDKEPRRIIIQVFLLGAISTLWALFFEILFLKGLYTAGIECQDCNSLVPDFLGAVNFQLLSPVSFVVLLGLAFIEEFIKYAIVKARMLKDINFDAPVDPMIYLIIGALGFAAAENIGYIISSDPGSVFGILYFRFFTATFLHALASAIVGYFFALSLIHKKNHAIYIIIGLMLATSLHALFNLFVLLIEESDFAFLYLTGLLVFMYAYVSYMFRSIKKIHYNLQQINN